MSLRPPNHDERGRPASTTGSVGRDSIPAPETFEVVADETRQRILEALHAAPDAPLQFSVLQQRADVDESTRFNYHLQVLLDAFVRETPDGYDLTARGGAFIDAVSAAPALDGAPDGPATESD